MRRQRTFSFRGVWRRLKWQLDLNVAFINGQRLFRELKLPFLNGGIDGFAKRYSIRFIYGQFGGNQIVERRRIGID
ncbi:MAG TPA: hypothetical protein VLN44_09065, partial [Pyrinomonadaceae bacterium]|nr:hypothetical protein [Pyrinomonadaceae bacterium]